MKIYEKVNKIQTKLKAPKKQFNKFSSYYFRNSEDILEAVKPFLEELKMIIKIDDDITFIGDRFYVKATVTLIDIESGEKIETTAFAREEEKRPKFDAPQLTGSSSSYARKYALNGLLAIDDTKDSDTTNTGNQNNDNTKYQAKPEKELSEKEQKAQGIEYINKNSREFQNEIDKYLSDYSTDSLDNIPIEKLKELCTFIRETKKQKKGA